MLEQIIAPGNTMIFGSSEFVISKLPMRKSWKLVEKCRVLLPTLKRYLVPVMVRVQAGHSLDSKEAVDLFFDLVALLDEEFVQHVQDQVFAGVMFSANDSELMPIVSISDEMTEMAQGIAFRELGIMDIYLLMARCLWINYQKDILYWTDVVRKDMAQKAAEVPVVPEPEVQEAKE